MIIYLEVTTLLIDDTIQPTKLIMRLIEIVERETVQQIILTKSSINFLGEAIGVGSCASGVIGQILHLLQPHNLRRFKQPISPLSEEDLRRTNREILVTR